MEFDLSVYLTASVQGVPLLFVVMAAVKFVKDMGLSGKALTAASLILGMIFGVGYDFFSLGNPQNFAGWFAYVVYGLGLGFTASTLYDMGKNVVEIAILRVVSKFFPEIDKDTPPK